jgi:hypothetical protein
MTVRKLFFVLVFLTIGIGNIFSQTYYQPNIGLKSHETLEILKAELTAKSTILYLSVENRITGGAFCADRNIYVIYPDGTRIKVIKASGIPQCPEYYKFKTIGEKLAFTLTFPPLKPGTEWIDLIEDCNDNCFSFYGILLNSDLNKRIDEAVADVDNGEIDTAISLYKGIIESIGSSGNGITGSLYSDLISLLVRKNYTARASEWYKKLLSSNVPQLQLYIKNLNSRGIKF